LLKQFHIQLTDRIKKPNAGNGFRNTLLRIGSIVVYPIALVIGLFLMILVGIFSIFQKLFLTKGKSIDIAQDHDLNDRWAILTEQNKLKIFQKYRGEVRFAPTYLSLKSEPANEFLDGKIFGDWFFYYRQGIFLQQWNSIDKPDTNLIFIDTTTFDAKVLQENIPSVLWDIVETDTKELQLTCDTGKEILKYKIELDKT